MTYAKFLDGFSDECAAARLSDTAYRVHSEAIEYLYGAEDPSCLILKGALSRFAASRHRSRGIAQLVAVGFWKDHGDCWEVVHHAEVIRESLRLWEQSKERNRRAASSWRDRQRGVPGPDQDQTRIQPGPDQAHAQAAEQGNLRDISAYPRTNQTSPLPPSHKRRSRTRDSP